MSDRYCFSEQAAEIALRGCVAFVLALTAMRAGSARCETAVDFGYGNMGTPAVLTTLVVLVDFSDTSPIPHDQNYWHQYVFNAAHQPYGVNGFFTEMSAGNFVLAPGETITISQPDSNRWGPVHDREGANATRWYHSNLVHHAMLAIPDFDKYDTSGDGTVTQEELLILFLMENEGGAVRYAGDVQPPGSSVEWSGNVATSNMAGTYDSLGLTVHELSHLFGAVDLYGIWGTGDQDLNNDLSIMSGLCHHDAWHKMQFGWVEPRVATMAGGGVATLYAPRLLRTDASLILYDGDVGADEFFLLEYRTQTNALGVTTAYDTRVAGNGLIVWHVYHDGSKMPIQQGELVYPTAEQDWFECVCGALVKRAALDALPCASTNAYHVPKFGTVSYPSDEHAVEYGTSGDSLERFRRCSKCGCLFFYLNQGDSSCPAGGTHDGAGNADHFIGRNVPGPLGHNHWRRCTECESLTYTPRWADSACPAWSGAHVAGGDEYTVIALWGQRTMMARSAPGLAFGENELWGPDTWTPLLTWYDGSATSTRLHVRYFGEGADSITVEWGTCIWVDFGYVGVEEGTFAKPFNTLAEGLAAVEAGGTLYVRGQSAETPTITKRVRIESYNGTATIGE